MSSQGYATPLRLELRPSPTLFFLILAAHGGGLLLLALTPLGMGLWLALALAVVLSLLRLHRRFLSAEAIDYALWDELGLWTLSRQNGESQEAELLPGSYVSPWLVALNFHCLEGRQRPTLVVLPDSLDATTFRRLRVRLQLEGGRVIS